MFHVQRTPLRLPGRPVAVAALGGSAAALAAAAWARSRFHGRIRAVERYLMRARPQPEIRTDLPHEVVRLAERLGAERKGADASVHLRQTGDMWLKPGAKPLPFTAHQTVAIDEIGFLWQARFRMAGLPVQIVEHLADGEAGLEGRLFDLLPVAGAVGDDIAFRGEAMRYMAELLWAPDAILFNRQLEWRVLDAHVLTVATGTGARRCEIRLTLDRSGLPAWLEADDRPFLTKGQRIPTAWFGRCGDYRTIAGRHIPMWGQAGWRLDGSDYVYWRGRIEAWGTGPAASG